LLHSQEHLLPFKALIYPTFASSLVNVFAPGRAGELIRLYSLRDKYKVRYSVGLSVIVVEQVINMMSLIMVSSFALGLILFTNTHLKIEILNNLLPYAFIGSLIMIVGIFLLFIVDPNRFIPLFSFLPGKIHSKITRLIHTFAFGLKTIKGKFYIFWVALGSSLVIWLIEGIMIWYITMDFINPNFEFPVALFASTLGNINFLFPILPGAAGQYEAFLAFVLTLSQFHLGFDATQVAITDRLIKTAILAVLGFYSLTKLGSDTITVLKKKPEDDIKEIEEAKLEFAD
jgi:uncharacterized protein (TIRG00374 family)